MEPPSPGAAVSELMQQLKNGEISKLQLFQQIAKLQATNAPAPNPMTTATADPNAQIRVTTTTTASRIFASTPPPPPPTLMSTIPAAPFVSFSYSPPRASATPGTMGAGISLQSRPSPAPLAPPSTSLGGSVRAKPMESDAEILSSGVSHDKAPRLSVQEWIASKTRGQSIVSSTAVVQPHVSDSMPSLLRGETSSPIPSALQSHRVSQYANGSIVPSALTPSLTYADTTVDRTKLEGQDMKREESVYAYTPSWHLGGQTTVAQEDHDPRYEHEGESASRPHEYVGFDRGHDERGPDHGSGTGTKNKNNAGEDAKFHARVTKWKSQKEAIREQMKQQLLQHELDECTFAPKVNPKSTKVVAKMRGRQKSAIEVETGVSVSERLYQEADNYKAREELAAKLKADEEAELQRECTFRPKINKNNPLTEKVKPKYMEIPKKDTPTVTPAAMEAAAKELEECTFQPRVNPINPEMVSAQLYLQQNIYERLSRPCIVSTDIGDSHSAFGEDSEYDEHVQANGFIAPGSRQTQDDILVRNRRRRTSALDAEQHQEQRIRPRSAGGIVTDEEKAERSRRFEDFLERQKFHEQARKKKLELTQQQLVPPHRPSINKASLQMMENGRKGDFLERITKYAIRKEQDSVKNKTMRISDPHCTFKPTINSMSSKRQGRTVTELSRGDLLRRETTQRLMKLKMEQEEMASLTFRPQLNRVSQRMEGRLKILSSPDTYLQRIQQQSQAHTIKQRRAIQEKEMEEFAECTFKPRTIDAPAYVQRIARSVTLTKALKKQQEAVSKANQKPEWK